jgi:hypothetical protein
MAAQPAADGGHTASVKRGRHQRTGQCEHQADRREHNGQPGQSEAVVHDDAYQGGRPEQVEVRAARPPGLRDGCVGQRRAGVARVRGEASLAWRGGAVKGG